MEDIRKILEELIAQDEEESCAVEGDMSEKTPEDLLDVGEQYLYDGKYGEAIAIYKEVIKRGASLPTLAKVCNDCGVAYASMERYDRAVGFFNAAASLREYLIDDGISVFRNLARVYSLMGDEEKAERSRKIAKAIEEEVIQRNREAMQMFSHI